MDPQNIEVTIYILPNLNTETHVIYNKLSSEFKLFEYSTEMFDNIIHFHYKLNLIIRIIDYNNNTGTIFPDTPTQTHTYPDLTI